MKLIQLEKFDKSPRQGTDMYIINLAANNLPTEVEISGCKTILRGIEYLAVSHLPYCKIGVMIDKQI